MTSKYKVGDKVTVRKTYHEGFCFSDYPFGFIDAMLQKYGGKVFTIDRVENDETDSFCDLYIEPYKYYLSEDDLQYTWSAAMFEENKIEDRPIIITSKRQKHKFNFNL